MTWHVLYRDHAGDQIVRHPSPEETIRAVSERVESASELKFVMVRLDRTICINTMLRVMVRSSRTMT